MIIFINGSINAGKTTVAKILHEKISQSALIEIDTLRAMIEWLPIDKAVPINLENAVAVIRTFTKHDIHAIVPYPLSERNYAYMVESLKDLNQPIHVFTLAPKLEKALTNRGARELSEAEQERIKHHYTIGIPTPSFGEIIDNSKQSPEETANSILEKLQI